LQSIFSLGGSIWGGILPIEAFLIGILPIEAFLIGFEIDECLVGVVGKLLEDFLEEVVGILLILRLLMVGVVVVLSVLRVIMLGLGIVVSMVGLGTGAGGGP
jgi:hypothetical protein